MKRVYTLVLFVCPTNWPCICTVPPFRDEAAVAILLVAGEISGAIIGEHNPQARCSANFADQLRSALRQSLLHLSLGSNASTEIEENTFRVRLSLGS